MSYTDVAIVPSSSWQATLQAVTFRGQLHTVWATAAVSSRGSPAAVSPARVGGGGSTATSSSLGTPQRRPRAASTGRYEPGHDQDFAAHGDLERHCGAPWFS